MMLGPVSAWLVWAVLAYAAIGLWAMLWQAGNLVGYLWQRWRDRGEELSEPPLSHPVWRNRLIREETERLLGLPPERTWEQMTSHQLPVGLPEAYEAIRGDMVPGPLERELWHDVERERRAPWWEAEHRSAYQACGIDYPSGLLARVREAGQ